MELDAQTLAVLYGTNKQRDTSAREEDGVRYRIISRPGRSERTVPPWALNEDQTRAVIVKVAISKIFRNKKVPTDFQPTFENLLSGTGGDWLTTLSALIYRQYRLHWHVHDTAVSLAMSDCAVMTANLKLRRAAELLGFDNGPRGNGRSKNATEEEILALWAAGKSIGQIRAECGACRARIRMLLKIKGLWYKRQTSRVAPPKDSRGKFRKKEHVCQAESSLQENGSAG
jgi:hypothetical protein